MPFPESCEFDVPWLIRVFALNETPSELNAPQTWASSLGTPSVSPAPPVPRSFRASYQITAICPVVGSSEIFGRNCEFVVVSSLTRVGPLHVAPPSTEYLT